MGHDRRGVGGHGGVDLPALQRGQVLLQRPVMPQQVPHQWARHQHLNTVIQGFLWGMKYDSVSHPAIALQPGPQGFNLQVSVGGGGAAGGGQA